MPSHQHPVGFNMKLCWACGEKRISRIETDAEKQCKSEEELVSFAVL